MCLGIPGKVVEVYERDGARMGKVNFDGIVKEICLSFVPEAEVGDYTIVQGLDIDDFSRERMNKTEAELREERAAIEELL